MKKKNPSPKTSPFFSVVVPLYNKKDYVRRSVGSILGQTFADFELIVVDDGSKDSGPKIVRGIKDPRVRLITQKNAGVSVARNTGVAAAQGKYVALLDADDKWEPDFLAAVKKLTEDFPKAGLYGTNYWIDDGAERKANPVRLPGGWRGRRRDFYDLMYYGRPPFCASSICLPTEVAQKYHFPPGIKAGEDILVWFNVSLKYDTVLLNKPLSTYYVEASANSHHVYFGAPYHLDWITLSAKLKREKALTSSAEKFIAWASLVQIRKMIANGKKQEALYLLAKCPKRHFPLYQAALYVLTFLPLDFVKRVRSVLSPSRRASASGPPKALKT